MSLKRFILVCGMLSILSACIDEVNLEEDQEVEEKLVVQGHLFKGDPSIFQVKVSQSIGIQETPVDQRVGGGRLWLLTDLGIEQEIPETAQGVYEYVFSENAPFQPERGRAYKIRLRLSGQEYESTFDTLYAVPQVDSLSLSWTQREVLSSSENIVTENFWQMLVHTDLRSGPGERKSHLKWEFMGVYEFIEFPPPNPLIEQKVCYITEDVNLDGVVVWDGTEASQDRLDGVLILEEPISHKLASGYYLTAFQQSLSKQAFTYWEQVSQVVSRSGGFLEPPPGKLAGNMHNTTNPQEEVLGLFYVSEIDTVRRLIRSREFPFQVQNFCSSFNSYEEAVEPCRNCLEWPNSTYNPPNYWNP